MYDTDPALALQRRGLTEASTLTHGHVHVPGRRAPAPREAHTSFSTGGGAAGRGRRRERERQRALDMDGRRAGGLTRRARLPASSYYSSHLHLHLPYISVLRMNSYLSIPYHPYVWGACWLIVGGCWRAGPGSEATEKTHETGGRGGAVCDTPTYLGKVANERGLSF